MQIIGNDIGFKMIEVWRKWFILAGLAAGILIGPNRPAMAMTFQSDIDPLVKQSEFIIRGTVKKLNAATLNVTPNNSMVEVRINEVLQASHAFINYTGIIAVQLKEPDSVNMGQQFIFFTNIVHDISPILTVTEVGRMEPPASSDSLRQQIAAAKQRLADQELQRQLAQIKSLLIGAIKKYDKYVGCGCYFKTPKEAQKEYWQQVGPYIFLDVDDVAMVHIDGKDVELKLVKSDENPDSNYKNKVGDKYRKIYRAGEIMVYLDYVLTEVCGPTSDKFCEWVEADGTITIQRGERKQTIKVKGGCGC
jgi:hypothetical protein